MVIDERAVCTNCDVAVGCVTSPKGVCDPCPEKSAYPSLCKSYMMASEADSDVTTYNSNHPWLKSSPGIWSAVTAKVGLHGVGDPEAV